MQLLMRFYDPNTCIPEMYKRVTEDMLTNVELQHEPESNRCMRYLTFENSGRVLIQATVPYGDPHLPPTLPLRVGIDLKCWRNVIGYVGQEPILFNKSAKENILWGLSIEERAKVSVSGG